MSAIVKLLPYGIVITSGLEPARVASVTYCNLLKRKKREQFLIAPALDMLLRLFSLLP